MKGKEEWCWRDKDSELAFGPFASREEAIEEARGADDRPRTVLIGRCTYPDSAFIAGQVVDVDFILENMEEFTYNNEFPHDDLVFELKDASAAHEALEKAMQDWAREHIKPPTVWHTSKQEEEVVINPEMDGG